MARNNKQSSASVATLAAETLKAKSSSEIAKQLAASVLSQRGTAKQTGAEIEATASKVLKSDKYNDNTKTLAASVLAQANKQR